MPRTPAASSLMPTEGPRILVVEDEASLEDTVRYNLQREGYLVSVATDGRAAPERAAHASLPKPFSIRELVSRVRANLRRAVPRAAVETSEEVLAGGPIRMDVARHEVAVRGQTIPMPPQEFELLEAFLRRQGRLLAREFLIEEVWGADYVGDTRTLDVHVKRLRRKVEKDPHRPEHLLTVRGLGYKFTA